MCIEIGMLATMPVGDVRTCSIGFSLVGLDIFSLGILFHWPDDVAANRHFLEQKDWMI
jgi:hypothetical protein